MSIHRVKEYLAAYGAADRVREFEVSSATVELAAKALGGERVILVVAAGDVKVDNRKYKDVFAAKAKMLAREDTESLTGHAAGGVCPFAVKEGVEVWLDESLKRFATVYPACGSAMSAIELTIPELETFSRAKGWVDVCKPYADPPCRNE